MQTHVQSQVLITVFFLVGNDTPESMADPWSTVPELILNLAVYSLCLVGGLLGNVLVISIMIREKTSRTLQSDSWKTNLFLLSLSVGIIPVTSTNYKS